MKPAGLCTTWSWTLAWASPMPAPMWFMNGLSRGEPSAGTALNAELTEGSTSAAATRGMPRFVDVAVDAVGPAGGQTLTYHLPDELGDVATGEAVLVEYGRRNAIGVVLGEAGDPDRNTKPVIARVRSDGPLLPQLQVALARHITAHYLAPPALVVRAMLAPGMLERVERVMRQSDDG